MLNKIDKEMKCLTQKREIKVMSKSKIFAKSRNFKVVAKYAHLKIVKLTCRENFMYRAIYSKIADFITSHTEAVKQIT